MTNAKPVAARRRAARNRRVLVASRRPPITKAMMTAPRQRRQRRRRRILVEAQPAIRVASQPTAFEPALAYRKPQLDTYASKSKVYTSLPAELQFQMTRLAPDEFDSPFVENGVPLDIPHQKMVGSYQYTYTPNAGATNAYLLVFNTGTAGSYYGYAPLQTLNASGATETISWSVANILGGYSTSSIFGTATYYDKLRVWASVIDLEVMGPAAQMTGIAHLGSISVASLAGGVTAQDLMKLADSRVDLRDPSSHVLRLRSGIQNRSSIHKVNQNATATWVLDDINEEYISYAVLANVQAGLGTGTQLSYGLQIGVTARAVWWPEGTQPLVKGLASSIVKNDSSGSMTKVDSENAQLLEKTSHVWTVPANLKEIVSRLCSKSTLKGLIGVMEKVYPPLGALNSFLGGTPQMLVSPAILEDDISLIKLDDRMEANRLHFPFWSPEALSIWDDIEIARADLVEQLSQDREFAISRTETFNSLERRTNYKHGQPVTRWFDGDKEVDVKALLQWESPTPVQGNQQSPPEPGPFDGFVRVGPKAGRSGASSMLSGR